MTQDESLYSLPEKRLIREVLHHVLNTSQFHIPANTNPSLAERVVEDSATLWKSLFESPNPGLLLGTWTYPMLKRILEFLLTDGVVARYDNQEEQQPPLIFNRAELKELN